MSWTAPTNGGAAITDYDVRYCDNSTGCDVSTEWTEMNDTGNNGTDTSTTATIYNLTNGTTYRVQVRAGNRQGDSAWSSYATGKPVDVPSTPASPDLVSGPGSLTVLWSASDANGSAITGYEVRYCDESVGCPNDSDWTKRTASSSATSLKLTGLTNNNSYSVEVQAKNGVGVSGWSGISTGTPGAPGKPSNLRLTAPSTGEQLNATWSAPSKGGADIDGYNLEYCNSTDNTCADSGDWTDAGHFGTTTSSNITGLTNGKAYKVRVRAENSIGSGGWSSEATATPAAAPAAPDAPTLTVKNRALDVTWSAPSNTGGAAISSFKVRRCDDSTGCDAANEWVSKNVSGGATTSTSLTGLTNGKTYQVQVAAVNRVGTGSWSTSTNATPAAKPSTPAKPTVEVKHQSLKVSWVAPADNGSSITGYDVQYRACTATPKTCKSSPTWGSWTSHSHDDTTTTTTIDSLTNDTAYQVQVRAKSNNGDSAWSPSGQAIPKAVPDAPDAPSLTAGDRQLSITWSAPFNDNGSAITDYDVQYRACTATPKSCASSPTWGSWSTIAHTGTATTASKTGLTNGTAYQVQVRAENANGESPWSSSTSAIPSGKPATPAKPTLTRADSELVVTWTAPSDNGSAITEYKVQYKEQQSDDTWPTGWTDHSHGDSTTTTTISGLTNGTKYRVRVAATNTNGDSPWSSHVEGSPAKPPDAPSDMSFESGNGSLKVIWSTPTTNGATISGYRLRYCDNSTDGGNDCSSDYTDWTTVTSSGTGTTKTISGLTNGREYLVELQAQSNQGNSQWSSQGTATPGAPAKPSAPSLAAGDGQITVTWSAPAHRGDAITSYEVAYCNNTDGDCAAGNWNTDYPSDVTNRTVTIYVTNGKTYKVRVRAENGRGWGPWSSTSSATPTSS